MREVHSDHIFSSKGEGVFEGYSETWYSFHGEKGQKDMHYGVRVSPNDVKMALIQIRHFGMDIITQRRNEKNNFNWRPFILPCVNEGYLWGSSFVVISQAKTLKHAIETSQPEYAISALSQTRASLRKLSKQIHLPLEKLVKVKS